MAAPLKGIRGWGLVAATGAVYFALAALGLRLTSELGYVSSLWPANGVLLAALLKSPRRWWPALGALCWAANVAASRMTLGAQLGGAAVLALPSLVEVFLALALLARFVGLGARWVNFGQALRFVLLAAVAAPLAAALLGAAIDHRLTVKDAADFLQFQPWRGGVQIWPAKFRFT